MMTKDQTPNEKKKKKKKNSSTNKGRKKLKINKVVVQVCPETSILL